MEEREGIVIEGYLGTWSVISEMKYCGETIYLLESEETGDEDPCLVVNKNLEVLYDEEWNGFNDFLAYDENNS